MRNLLPFVITSIIFSQSIHQMEMEKYEHQVQTGLDVLINEKLEIIKGQKVGLVTNHTGVDRSGKPNYEILMQLSDVDLKAIFAPEHGFFGNVSRGQKVDDLKQDGLPVIYSLYGKTDKPTPDMFEGLDVIIYDIQDIGARFYTYISTLGLVMEAAAEADIPVIVLDRPNPLNGITIEGPVLDINYKSFVGMYPIPIRYLLTIGELAKMIIGEKWIEHVPKLTVIEMAGWERTMYYDDTGLSWISPSPNIPDLETAILYPGMCLFEGTNVSEGRGTNYPFQYIGAPWIDSSKIIKAIEGKHIPGVVFEPISFIPISIPGKSLKPKFENEKCYGIKIILIENKIYKSVDTAVQLLKIIQELYPEKFQWNDFIYKLWGN
ncbi:MAG TPA: DUF1343 domain-containing protein, partial [Candidatus Marinimicrobia bacterium]|nr:DUF1343 domain-containing protein [Candidatus Neomarinimicrobiota bacterium]